MDCDAKGIICSIIHKDNGKEQKDIKDLRYPAHSW
jgi:hypothetical protein